MPNKVISYAFFQKFIFYFWALLAMKRGCLGTPPCTPLFLPSSPSRWSTMGEEERGRRVVAWRGKNFPWKKEG